MLLLNCSISWCQNNDTNFHSTGEFIKSDTLVTIDINSIRKANVLMIERNYLLDITTEQDSIICLHKLYISQQDSIINDFQQRVIKNNKINEDINKAYERERRKTIILGTSTAVLAGLVTTMVLINTLK